MTRNFLIALTLFSILLPRTTKAEDGVPAEPSSEPAATIRAATPPATADWKFTEGTAGGWRYSPLADITPENVADLKVAWSYQHGDVHDSWFPMDEHATGTSFQATPLLVEGKLIFPTPYNRVIALDPATGNELWTFDPEVDDWRMHANMMICRGVTYWRDPRRTATGPCSARILMGTLDSRLIAIDLETGKRCEKFGNNGEIDLTDGIEPLVDPY
ncbi:MAG: PQQ-binding-like beta-propeller repeat protein, partial [Pseudomonadales bacterium]|nr:PQQ-binding-like beta-propeller repeat protein [Pseudomonadales bacterium]